MDRPTELDAATFEGLIRAAVAAPSIHNTQPWRFGFDQSTGTVHVRADAERGLRQTDPRGRALHVSVGAALKNLTVAACHAGWTPKVTLFPDRTEPELLATVHLLGEESGPPGSEDELYEAIWHRHTSRRPFEARALPHALVTRLTEAARADGAVLMWPGPDGVRRLMRLTAEAERRNVNDPRRRAESRAWVRAQGTLGMPRAALGPQDAQGHVPVRDFGALLPPGHMPPEEFEQLPHLAVLATGDDQPQDWLRAGQALEHVLLLATRERVRASFFYQALEWHDLRWALRDADAGPAYVQMIMRLGYGPEGAATPRRPPADVTT
ncbi:hypothetical protein [Streptomyces sp. ICBB 8177]|uniref:Acg family FMN-binding oxidoreductase n=1 Tax=Streptomyces sp. ICBB 8177 TaxID=563922 RepID=UPI000D67646A|nr:hypothetical protein [Streptomyces sp. ICBB 8177]PWI44941.1 hypothetical protein CK485_07070 [Streptomyces sp. ICBB 8177]